MTENDTTRESVRINLELTAAATPLWCAHFERFLGDFPKREELHTSMTGDEVIEVWPKVGGIYAFQVILEEELRRLAWTAAHVLSYRQVAEEHQGDTGKVARIHANLEYEHFLYRLFAFEEKTLQAWNALRGSVLDLEKMKPHHIQKQLKASGPDALHAELEAFWEQPRAKELMEKRNIAAHRYPWGDGFPFQGKPKVGEGGKWQQLDVGAQIGKIDWAAAKRDIEDGVKLAYEARRIVSRHEAESLAPWTVSSSEANDNDGE